MTMAQAATQSNGSNSAMNGSARTFARFRAEGITTPCPAGWIGSNPSPHPHAEGEGGVRAQGGQGSIRSIS